VGALALVVLLLARQYLTLRQNTLLATRLAAREEELHYRAFHDALTGLANRTLFHERLEHALELHARDRRPLAVVYLDWTTSSWSTTRSGTSRATSCWCG
jgi:PleD family two-component response regulator